MSKLFGAVFGDDEQRLLARLSLGGGPDGRRRQRTGRRSGGDRLEEISPLHGLAPNAMDTWREVKEQGTCHCFQSRRAQNGTL